MRSNPLATAARGRPALRGAHPGRTWLVTLTLLALVIGLVPAMPAAAGGRTAQVDVYFGRPHDTRCDVVRAHRRTVDSPAVLKGALEELLEGPTRRERRRGASSWFSAETAGMLRSVAIRDGVAHVDLRDLRQVIPGASSSCGSANLLAELDRTVLQFPTVHRVRYSIKGSERRFYNWVQTSPPPRSRVTGTAGSLHNARPLHRRGTGAVGEIRRIRVGRHDGFDRVVFEFSGRGRPWYHVSYTPVARSDGSGMPIPVKGNVALEVRIMAASVDLDDPDFRRTYTPATPITPRFPTLRQVRDGGQFEGNTTFGVGLKGRTGFRVLELKNPSRLAIDIAHGASVRPLRRGSRGADVADWQARLATVQHGHFAVSPRPFARPLVADGIFGKRTAKATRVFQRAEGVTVTGVVDGATRAAMHRALRRTNRVAA